MGGKMSVIEQGISPSVPERNQIPERGVFNTIKRLLNNGKVGKELQEAMTAQTEAEKIKQAQERAELAKLRYGEAEVYLHLFGDQDTLDFVTDLAKNPDTGQFEENRLRAVCMEIGRTDKQFWRRQDAEQKWVYGLDKEVINEILEIQPDTSQDEINQRVDQIYQQNLPMIEKANKLG